METSPSEIRTEYWKVPKSFRKTFNGRFGCPAFDSAGVLIGYCKTYPQPEKNISFEESLKTFVRLL